MRLEFLQRFLRLVDECEASALPTTKVCAEAEDRHGILVGFVEFGEFGTELVFRNIGPVGVKDVS